MIAKKPHIIEVVCTGNNGRSPMAEVIGNNIVKDFDLENKLSFISSGTRASSEYDNIFTYEKVVAVLGVASAHGLMKPINVDKKNYENDFAYSEMIKQGVNMAFRILRPVEAALRDAALYNIGMKYDGTRTQTVARDDVSLVLGMEQKHIDQVNKIYSESEHKPMISTITKYIDIPKEIPDSIGNHDPAVYRSIRLFLTISMPKVIDKFTKEYKL